MMFRCLLRELGIQNFSTGLSFCLMKLEKQCFEKSMKPIFYQKVGLHWVTNMNEMYMAGPYTGSAVGWW